MIEVDWKPDAKKLRSFGWFALVGFPLIGLVITWKMGAFDGEATFRVLHILGGIGLAGGLLAAVAPRALKPLYIVMTAIALPIGFVISNILLALLFYGLFTPIALYFRLRGRDPLNRKLEPEAESYWIETPKPRPAEDYYRQF